MASPLTLMHRFTTRTDRVLLRTGLADPIQGLFTPMPVTTGGITPASRRQEVTDKPGLDRRLERGSFCTVLGDATRNILPGRAMAEAPQLPLPPSDMSLMPSAGLRLGPGVRNYTFIPQNVHLPLVEPSLPPLPGLAGIFLTLLNHSFLKPVLY